MTSPNIAYFADTHALHTMLTQIKNLVNLSDVSAPMAESSSGSFAAVGIP